MIHDYPEEAGHGEDRPAPLFQPVKNNRTGKLRKALTSKSVLRNIVQHYGEKAGIQVDGFCTHAVRATAATNALDNDADIAEVQKWLGHANIATTRLYDRRQSRPEKSPTFKVSY